MIYPHRLMGGVVLLCLCTNTSSSYIERPLVAVTPYSRIFYDRSGDFPSENVTPQVSYNICGEVLDNTLLFE
jgi:hypothetical protein